MKNVINQRANCAINIEIQTDINISITESRGKITISVNDEPKIKMNRVLDAENSSEIVCDL